MKYCDNNEHILEWGSEEIVIPYRCPTDGRVHRYYPDFYVKLRDKDNVLKKYIIEIKPRKQTEPPKKPSRQTKKYLGRGKYLYEKHCQVEGSEELL